MKRKYLAIIILPVVFFIASFFFSNRAFADTLITSKSLNCRSQGATIVDNYFVYTDYCGDGDDEWEDENSKTSIRKCQLSGTSCGESKNVVTNAKLKHANALDYQWGGNGNFWVFDGWCNPATGGCKGTDSNPRQWCYNVSTGNRMNLSECGSNSKNTKNGDESGTSQGFSRYGNYSLKGFSGTNKIYIYQNGSRIETYDCGYEGELEDVMVDGKTGDVYYTTSGSGWVKLYKTTYKLPPASTQYNNQNPVSPNDQNKNNNNDQPTKTEKKKDNTVDTILFGKIKDDGKGCGVYMILNIAVDILSIGIGIVAVIGIAVAGISYQSAKGNEARTTKAKRRILEIVLGLAAYAIMYAALNWLLPGGKMNTSTTCKTACTSTETRDLASISL